MTINKIVEEIKGTYKLRNSEYKKKKRDEFEDIYNPMKVYAHLRFGLGINQSKARELSEWYRDCFYKIALDEYYNEKSKRSK